MIRLAISGACGRMGLRIAALAHESGQFSLAAALDRKGHERIGQDIGTLAGIGPVGVAVTDHLEGLSACDVVVDFSLPAGVETRIAYCREHRIPLVVGTTGLADDQRQKLKDAAGATPILLAANMSLGVNLLFALVGEVARKLGDSYDPEIIETHHRFKRDAPSGTALELARRLAEAQGWSFPACLAHGRQGPDAVRQDRTIGMHAVRAGDTVGEHRVIFSTLGETVELRHSAHSRDNFARGALRAAAWLVGQGPGLYGMADVLGL